MNELLGTRQTVILAAGNGSRLSAARGNLPKPLVRVAGRALIEHALDQAAAAGVEEAVIVTGNAADQMRAHLETVESPLRLTVVYNARYHEPNGVSLLAAAPFISGPFFLQMADHVFAQPVLRFLDRADAAPADAVRLLVDYHPVNLDEDDATKVCTEGAHITAIGKDVYPYHAVDTGCFRLDPRVFQRVHRSWIVNLNQVRQVKPHTNGECFLILESGADVKVSRSYRDVVARFVH